jgi:hypothetical protein
LLQLHTSDLSITVSAVFTLRLPAIVGVSLHKTNIAAASALFASDPTMPQFRIRIQAFAAVISDVYFRQNQMSLLCSFRMIQHYSSISDKPL